MGGQGSKLEFRKKVFNLIEEKEIPEAKEEVWRVFWTDLNTDTEVFSLVTGKDVQKLVSVSFENYKRLYKRLVGKLLENSKDTARWNAGDDEIRKETLNCIRMLTRLTGFLFSEPQDFNRPERYTNINANIKRRMDIQNKVLWTQSGQKSNEKDKRFLNGEKVGQCLVETIVRLLFTEGFCIENGQSEVWEERGQQTGVKDQRTYANRAETLRLLTVLVSQDMFKSPQRVLEEPNLILEELSKSKKLGSVFESLINSGVKGIERGEIIWLLGKRAEAGEEQIQIAELSLLILNVILDYEIAKMTKSKPEEKRGRIYNEVEKIISSQEKTDWIIVNGYKIVEQAMKRSQSIVEAISKGSSAAISSVTASVPQSGPSTPTIPGRPVSSTTQMGGGGSNMSVGANANATIEERVKWLRVAGVVMMLTQLSTINREFKEYFGDHNILKRMLVQLINIINVTNRQTAHVGMIRGMGHLIHKLSETAGFGVQVIMPFTEFKWMVPIHLQHNIVVTENMTYVDYLIQTTHNLVVNDTRQQLKPMYSSLFITIRNVSHLIGHLSTASVRCLLDLFERIASDIVHVVSHDQIQALWLVALLDTFVSICQNNPQNNSYLVFQLLQTRSTIDGLFALLPPSPLHKSKLNEDDQVQKWVILWFPKAQLDYLRYFIDSTTSFPIPEQSTRHSGDDDNANHGDSGNGGNSATVMADLLAEYNEGMKTNKRSANQVLIDILTTLSNSEYHKTYLDNGQSDSAMTHYHTGKKSVLPLTNMLLLWCRSDVMSRIYLYTLKPYKLFDCCQVELFVVVK